MNNSAVIHRCHFCKRRLPTEKGVSRHIQNTPACRERWNAAVYRPSASGLGLKDTLQQWESEHMDIDIPLSDIPPSPADVPPLPPLPVRSHSVEIEEDLDEDDIRVKQFVQKYPRLVGTVLAQGQTVFEKWEAENRKSHLEPFAPFASQEEWELAVWLIQNVGHNRIEEFLKLAMVSLLGLSWRDKLGLTSMWLIAGQALGP